MARPRKRGAKRGKRQLGYWFRAGRCWVVTAQGKPVPLKGEDGKTIKDPNDTEGAQRAYARWLLTEEKRQAGTLYSVGEVCEAYLASVKDKASTYNVRSKYLQDLCTGSANTGRKGYGTMPAAEFLPHHLREWIATHEGWKSPSTEAIAMQAVSRAFHWATEQGMLTECKLKNLKVPRSQRRVTYFPPEEEALLLKHAHPNMQDALFACIYTGARPGEIARLRPDMVAETPHGQVWTFKEHKTRHKTGRDRRVLVPEMVAELVRKRIKRQGKGPVFPTPQGQEWYARNMAQAFKRLRGRIKTKEGIELHEEACWYTCRHTFAQRMLSGQMPWQNGHACQLQQVAQAMGNSVKVCWQHYGCWESEALTWTALKPSAA